MTSPHSSGWSSMSTPRPPVCSHQDYDQRWIGDRWYCPSCSNSSVMTAIPTTPITKPVTTKPSANASFGSATSSSTMVHASIPTKSIPTSKTHWTSIFLYPYQPQSFSINQLNAFERARILGFRSRQLEQGDAPTIDVLSSWTSLEIASHELYRRTIPITLIRQYSSTHREAVDIRRLDCVVVDGSE